MKKTCSVSRAWTLYRRYFPQMMLGLLLQIVLRLIVATPLLFLAAQETRVLALMTLPLFVLIVLPARQNAAQVMARLHQGYGFDLMGFVSFENYGKKLLHGLKTTLLMLLWALPFIVATGFLAFVYGGKTIEGVTDTFTVLRTVINLGNHQLVKTLLPVSDTATIRGVMAIIVMYLLTALPILIGWAFHSGSRHAAALGVKLRSRGRVMGVWFLSLVTLVPFIVTAGAISMGFLKQLLGALSAIGQGSFSLPPLEKNMWLLVAAFVVLLLPVIPFKQLLPAACVHKQTIHEEAQA